MEKVKFISKELDDLLIVEGMRTNFIIVDEKRVDFEIIKNSKLITVIPMWVYDIDKREPKQIAKDIYKYLYCKGRIKGLNLTKIN